MSISLRLTAGVSALLATVAIGVFHSASALAANPYQYEAALTEKLNKEAPGGSFAQPWGIAFDQAGNVYVADPHGLGEEGILDKFDPANSFLEQLGGGEPRVLSGRFTRSIAVGDESGHVYVGDSNGSEVFVLSPTGEKLSQWTGANTPTNSFGAGSSYVYTAVDNSTSAAKGDIYVLTNRHEGEVDVLEPQGEDKEEGKYVRSLKSPEGFQFEGGGANGVNGLAVNDSSGPEAGEVYVADPENRVVDRFSAEGTFEAAHQLKGPSPSERFKDPAAVAVDSATGDVFVVDSGAKAVDQFGPSGEFVAQITGTGPSTPFSEPVAVAVQRSGPNQSDLYVSDAEAKTVDIFGPEVPEAPSVAEESVTQLSADAANLAALIGPHGQSSSYRFEYGACTSASTCSTSPYEYSAPTPEGTVGAEGDFGSHNVSVHVQNLTASATYHFRAVAHNLHGEKFGEERSFTTQNGGGELALPDGRQWELVSPPEKHGGVLGGISESGVIEAAAGGGAFSYVANAPIEPSSPGFVGVVQAISTRSSIGWVSRNIAPPHEHATGAGAGVGGEYRFFSDDLSTAIVQPFGRFNPAISPEASEQTPYVRTLGSCESSCYRPLVSGAPAHENVPAGTHFGEELLCEEENGIHSTVETTCGPLFLDATDDLSHVVLSSQAPLAAGAPREELYEWSGGKLALVSVLPQTKEQEEKSEELPALAGTARLGFRFGRPGGSARRAISADGSRVFWEVEATESLYLRDTTRRKSLQLDAAEPACLEEPSTQCESGGGHFQIASADGSRVFFTDQRKLTSDSGAAANEPDLYECKISEGPAGPRCELEDLTPAGSGGERASVQGDVLGASEDGATLYFVAEGKLGVAGAQAGTCINGAEPPVGECNLYARVNNTTRLVARLAGNDLHDWTATTGQASRVSPNGQWVTFMSERSLTGYDNHDAKSGKPDAEVYLYDASGAGSLSCASCNPSGARPDGVEYAQLTSANGEGLTSGHGEWTGSGWVTALLPVVTAFKNEASAYQSRYLNNEGRLFFNGLDPLVPQDVNGNWDVYQHEPSGLGSCKPEASTFDPNSRGCTSLISSGSAAQESAFLDASETGGDVFFLSSAKLTSQDIDSNRDVYDAHVCTPKSPCIPPPPVSPPPCSTEASCKAAPSPQPQVFGAPPSATFNGLGNVTPAAPAVVKPKVKPPTRRQKLNAALKACQKRPKKQRAGCVKQARKRYGPVEKAKKKSRK